MNKSHFVIFFRTLSHSAYYLVLLASLALVLALPTRAEERAARSKVSPVYPEIAKRMKIGGEVRVAVTVDPQGKVTDVKPVSGNSVLSAAAQDAVRKWRFEPGPSSTTFTLGIEFEIAR
jgi:TonB family protein